MAVVHLQFSSILAATALLTFHDFLTTQVFLYHKSKYMHYLSNNWLLCVAVLHQTMSLIRLQMRRMKFITTFFGWYDYFPQLLNHTIFFLLSVEQQPLKHVFLALIRVLSSVRNFFLMQLYMYNTQDHVEGYHKLSAKTKIFFSTAVALWDADFYVKVDDDVHLNLGTTLCMHL